jgi:hypothetical protein
MYLGIGPSEWLRRTRRERQQQAIDLDCFVERRIVPEFFALLVKFKRLLPEQALPHYGIEGSD